MTLLTWFSPVIVAASPDERHWGGSGFTKNDQSGLGGFLLYFPSWTLPELEVASHEVLTDAQLANNTMRELHAVFGGIPRNVFFPAERKIEEQKLKAKVDALTHPHLKGLVTGQLNRHSGFGADQPKGGVVDFVAIDDFSDVELRLASSSILHWARSRFMKSIWTEMATYPSPVIWQLLGDYVLCALQGDNQYTTRSCVGRTNAAYSNLTIRQLGGCIGKSLVADCTVAVIAGPDLTVFYSSDRFHKLYDMIYKNGNIYYAFQVAMGKSHDAKQHQIDALVAQLHIGTGDRTLELYYAIHEGVFDDFATKPVEPTANHGVSIFHLKLTRGLE